MWCMETSCKRPAVKGEMFCSSVCAQLAGFPRAARSIAAAQSGGDLSSGLSASGVSSTSRSLDVAQTRTPDTTPPKRGPGRPRLNPLPTIETSKPVEPEVVDAGTPCPTKPSDDTPSESWKETEPTQTELSNEWREWYRRNQQREFAKILERRKRDNPTYGLYGEWLKLRAGSISLDQFSESAARAARQIEQRARAARAKGRGTKGDGQPDGRRVDRGVGTDLPVPQTQVGHGQAVRETHGEDGQE